ncbi:MAG: hypothetical protein IJM18_10830 [Clostridia bacterium]|nr:hypothetical protein [Clostridia bacterium]
MEIKGIDVSKWQGRIDWKKAAESGVRFAMIKALQGLSPDPRFEENAKGAADNGIYAGAYVFSLAKDPDEAEAEAEAALDACAPYNITWPVAMDFEGAHFEKMKKSERGAIITAFCERIKRGGMIPMLYSNRDWFTRLIPVSVRDEYPVWLAQWRAEKPDTGFEYAMWQSGAGSVGGIEGDVDIDTSYVDFSLFSRPQASFRLTRPRSRGEAYLMMQRALNAAGYRSLDGRPLKEDGVWGKKSREAFLKMLKANE